MRFDSRDHYIQGPNPDDSGAVTHKRTTRVAGAMFKLDPRLHLYVNSGEGFETPTFAELAYRPGGQTGLNFGLQPAKSRHYEAGLKARPAEGVRMSAAVYRIDTRDEIVTNTSAGGRTDFRNASHTRRDGIELTLDARLGGGFAVFATYSGINARFTEDFSSGTPPATVAAGRKLPGVPASMLYADRHDNCHDPNKKSDLQKCASHFFDPRQAERTARRECGKKPVTAARASR